MGLYDNKNREWTLDELIAELSLSPANARVLIEDADTSWTIPKFSVRYDSERNQFWFEPCNYSDMSSKPI